LPSYFETALTGLLSMRIRVIALSYFETALTGLLSMRIRVIASS